MENFDRDKFAKELKDARALGEDGKELAQDLKTEVNKTEEYIASKEKHIQDNFDERSPDSQKNINKRADLVRGEITELKKAELEKAFDKTQEQLEKELGIVFGPTSGPIHFDGVGKLAEVTSKETGEKWRLLTEDEAKRIVKPIDDLVDSKLFSEDEHKRIVSSYFQGIGFDLDRYYTYGNFPEPGTMNNTRFIYTAADSCGIHEGASWRDDLFDRMVKDTK